MLLSAEQLSINFGSRQLLQDVDFYLNEGDKTGVIGINGTGKSTFLKVLAGLVQPDSGRISRRPNLQVSYLPQNPEMDDDRTILEQVFASMPPQFRALNEYEAKAMLTKLGLGETDRRIGTLSGGERRRAALCAALIHPADVLVLDEPTNHMDMRSKDILKRALQKYDGTVVVVSHDREFLDGIVDKVYEFRDGGVKEYLGGIYYFLEKRKLDSLRDVERKEAPAPAAAPKTEAPKLTYEQKKEQEKLLRKLRRAVESIETELAETEQRIADYDARFAAATAYDEADYKAYDDLKAHYDHLMHEWEKASYELEITENG